MEIFIIIGFIMVIPVIITVFSELIVNKKYKQYQAVKVSRGLFSVCIIGEFVSIFAFASNLYAYVTFGDDLLWFLIMMGIVYLGMNMCLFVMHREKVFYSGETNEIVLMKNFKKFTLNRKNITRFYLSDDYVDFYIGDNRIRYGNNFLIGTLELNDYFKN